MEHRDGLRKPQRQTLEWAVLVHGKFVHPCAWNNLNLRCKAPGSSATNVFQGLMDPETLNLSSLGSELVTGSSLQCTSRLHRVTPLNHLQRIRRPRFIGRE